MGDSAIAWTEKIWNPVEGCSRVSSGCEHCYAERLIGTRMRHLPWADGLTRPDAHGRPVWTGEVRCLESRLAEPLHWRKPARVFVCSRSDLFHEKVPDEFIAAVFGVMAACPHITFQVLTKRARRMREWFSRDWDHHVECGERAARAMGDSFSSLCYTPSVWPLPNVWLGVTAEDQRAADERIPELLATPAAVRWVSVEPMIGPVVLDGSRGGDDYLGDGEWLGAITHADGTVESLRDEAPPGIDWVVVGAESGPDYRRCDTGWVQDLARQCREAGTALFVKQLHADRGLIRHPCQFPDDLRVREYPEVARG